MFGENVKSKEKPSSFYYQAKLLEKRFVNMLDEYKELTDFGIENEEEYAYWKLESLENDILSFKKKLNNSDIELLARIECLEKKVLKNKKIFEHHIPKIEDLHNLQDIEAVNSSANKNNEVYLPKKSQIDGDSIEKIKYKSIDKLKFQQTINGILNNQENINLINRFPINMREGVIGFLIQYCIIFPEGGVPNLFLQKLYKKVIIFLYSKPEENRKYIDISSIYIQKLNASVIIDMVKEKLRIKKPVPNFSDEEMIYSYIYNHFCINGYFYHSFNSAFEDSIISNGLDPNKRLWDYKEISEISNLFEERGMKSVFGWLYLNSVSKISITNESRNIYHYGASSPEWFAQFVGEGMHIQSNEYNMNAFRDRDYYEAKRNIQYLCDNLMNLPKSKIDYGYKNMTTEERNKVLKFFDKYWERLAANTTPKCALINKRFLKRSETIPRSLSEFNNFFENDDLDFAVSIILGGSEIDTQVSDNIPAEEMVIIDLPQYNAIK